MLSQWNIGRIKVSSIREYFGPTHPASELFPELDRSLLARHQSWLAPKHYAPALDCLVVAIQIWICEVDDKVIVIDTGVGNRKNRTADRMHQLNTLFLYWAAAAGATRERVTHVALTHLHNDHVGWNTVLVDGRWEPTFPNATYYFPERDLEFIRAHVATGDPLYRDALGDSIEPILNGGLARMLTTQTEIADVLRIAPAPGHTPGQLNFWIESQGEHGVFSADVLHHPIQMYQPDCNSVACSLPDDARRTRHAFLRRAAETGALVMPCHFGRPHSGYVRRAGDGYAFEPASDN